VINAQGQISFPKDTAPYCLQRSRLKKEGIVFEGEKIRLKRYQWDGIASDSETES
jgi:alkylated DNA nucleotide flippase Atl1